MKAVITINKKNYHIDLSAPQDISMPLKMDADNVNAWYVEEPKKTEVQSVKEGNSTNFNTITFNPHAHGTHTECVGHITQEFYSINKLLTRFFFKAEVITVAPEKLNGDFVISKKQLKYALGAKKPAALVIRTMPNHLDKMSMQYGHTNPPYLLEDAATFIREIGVSHLLIDLPSVDKEKDGGALLAHKAFWNFSGKLRKKATITEFIYVPNQVLDGSYILNLQIASFDNDATPSKPILYNILQPNL
jgi:kynurenine formamidase